MSDFTDKVGELQESVHKGFSPSMDGSEDEPQQETPKDQIKQFTDSFAQEPEEREAHAESAERPQEEPQRLRRTKVEVLKAKLEQQNAKNSYVEIQNRELERLANEQRNTIEQMKQQLSSNDEYKNAYYESNLNTREIAIKNELRVAKENGDIDREIELSEALAEVKADKATHNLYKHQLVPQQQQQQERERARQYPAENPYQQFREAPQPVYNPSQEAYDNWLENNAWADQQSDQFSPRLYNEANEIATNLADLLRYDGNARMIGTPQYFAMVGNAMSERYGVNQATQQSAEPAQQRQGTLNGYSNVSPVGQSGSVADQYVSRNPTRSAKQSPLSDVEFRIARNIQVRRNDGTYATGDEAVKEWAKNKKDNSTIDPSNPYKITFD